MEISELAELATQFFDKNDFREHAVVSPLPGLTLLKSTKKTELDASVYDPVICLILQGEKETIAGDKSVKFGAGESLIVSHSLPVLSRITKATPSTPYLAMILTIDLGILRGLYHDLEEMPRDFRRAKVMTAEKTGEEIITALARYLALSRQRTEIKVMAPLLLKEIHFRLLMAPHGTMLRKLMGRETYASQIATAINHLRANFKKPLSVTEMAKTIGMSESAFFEHFKRVTETTPLQYQKEMRLIEARRLLRQERLTVSSAAFEVGYESPTQFSREYSRKFGCPPRDELKYHQP